MRQDVRLRNYYYGCSRGSSVLLIVRVAQVTYWRHYYDYDLSLACFQYISSVSHFKSRLHHGPNNQMMDGHFCPHRSFANALRIAHSEGPVAVVADEIELAGLNVRHQGLVNSRQVPPIRCAIRLAVLPMLVRICWFHPKAKSQSSRMRSSSPD